jgi:hypothetical protein
MAIKREPIASLLTGNSPTTSESVRIAGQTADVGSRTASPLRG